MRPPKEAVFMGVAHLLAQLGTCDRKKVGAIIVRDGRCVSWGYNGAPPGQPHCAENNHGWNGVDYFNGKQLGFRDDDGVWHPGATVAVLEEYGCRNATHAEANALAFAARQGISTDGATLFVTVSPCDVCARLIIAAGIKEVIWDEEYRDRAGIELIEQALKV